MQINQILWKDIRKHYGTFFFNPEICALKCKNKINVAATLVQTEKNASQTNVCH